jgi:hypothetical protein
MKNLLILIFSLFSLFSSAQTFAWEVCEFNQGTNNLGGPVAIERSNPDKALGQPQNDDIQSSNINFVSLGFGGDIKLKLQASIPVTPFTTMIIYETTFNFINCQSYPETADIYLSKNDIDYVYLGQTCLNDNTILDVYQTGLDSVLYIKVYDISDVTKFSGFSFISDGYDLDGIEFFENGPLAIVLKSFEVKYSNKNIYIKFITASETNTYKFIIQSSIDSKIFIDVVDFVAAGFSSFDRIYDRKLIFEPKSNITYFRLVEIDLNGNIYNYEILPIVTTDKQIEYYYYDLLGRRINANDINNDRILKIKSEF